MKHHRRKFLSLAAASVVTPFISRFAAASSYPTRPVRWIVGFPPGGPADILSRIMGQWLSERLGQAFVIENRAGAAGNIATEAAARAPADGYTLLQVGPPHAINPALYDKLEYNFFRDIVPAIIALARAMTDRTGNLPPMPGNLPRLLSSDYS